MYNYDDEIKLQIVTNIQKIAFPILLPLYILFNVIDWVVAPDFAAYFLLLRLLLIPLGLLGYADLKFGWSKKWYPVSIWIFGLILTCQLTYMAFCTASPLTSVYLFTITLMAGLFLFFFTMRFAQNMVTLLVIYAPPLLALFFAQPVPSILSPFMLVSVGMFAIYAVAAKSMDGFRHRAYQQKTNLFFLATTDALSGLKLRRYFFNRFIQELSIRLRKRQNFDLAVAAIDIDDFKAINDRYGHEIGDKLIKHLSDIFRNSIRVYDTACRFGGEEFLILFPETKLEEAEIVSRRICEAVHQIPLEVGHEQIRVTISVGVAGIEQLIPEDFERVQRGTNYKYVLIQQMLEIIKKSDEALYEAKRMGKNQVVCGQKLKLVTEVDEQVIDSLKGYLVYFDQDVFSLPSDEIDPSNVMIGEMNFYTEEYFFRRAVESMYRSYRDPEWSEMLAIVHVEHRSQKIIRREFGKIFRLADTVCMLNAGRYGLIFFGLEVADINKVISRIEENLKRALDSSEVKVKIAIASLKFDVHKESFRKHRLLTYREFSDRVAELMGVLKQRRFAKDERLYCFAAAQDKNA